MKTNRSRQSHALNSSVCLPGLVLLRVSLVWFAGVWHTTAQDSGGGTADSRALVQFDGSGGTRTVMFPWDGGGAGLGEVSFELGFRTSEPPDAGLLHDSFSVTLYRVGMPGSTMLAVSDVFGLMALPTVPGSLAIPAAAVTITSVPPGLAPMDGETVAFAYELKVTLPAVYRGRELGLELGCFDNGDSFLSTGYVRASVVPEPGLMALGGVGICLGAWMRILRVGGVR